MAPHPAPRLVIDTNIFVPGLVGATAVPARASASASLLRAWRAELCSLIVSDALLEEYREVLQRAPFSLPAKRAAVLCTQVASRAILVSPTTKRRLLKRDPDDDMVLQTALAGRADLLVTDNIADFAEIAALRGGTRDLRFRGVRVVGLSACLNAIRATHVDAERIMRRSARWR